jgi:rhamnosyltransferase
VLKIANSVCGIVVTFFPEQGALENLTQLRSQVEGLIVVDNASSVDGINSLRAASQALEFELVENGENLGIAAAMNIGVRRAKALGYRFVALFDQDSTVTPSFIDAMVRSYQSNPNRERVAILGATYEHRVTGASPKPGLLAKDGGPIEVMTSGSFMPIEIFDRCGYFQEDLIIDRVDYEYCFRVRDCGYRVMICPGAKLIHSAGAPAEVGLLGKTLMVFSNHSAARWYYISRNSVLLVRKYGARYPRWATGTILYILVKAPLKIVLVRGDKWKKIGNVIRGISDGILGRTGKRVPL